LGGGIGVSEVAWKTIAPIDCVEGVETDLPADSRIFDGGATDSHITQLLFERHSLNLQCEATV
jgi:hypothetical protein